MKKLLFTIVATSLIGTVAFAQKKDSISLFKPVTKKQTQLIMTPPATSTTKSKSNTSGRSTVTNPPIGDNKTKKEGGKVGNGKKDGNKPANQ